MRVKITIAYDGTHYCGWQVQSNRQSIQKIIQNALETILRHSIQLTGSGRTDAGVHAHGQVAHFDTDVSISMDRIRYAVNALLPVDIRILHAEIVNEDFHARYSATSKIYHYHLHLDRVVNPMTRLYKTPVHGPFDENRLRSAAILLLGTHDFVTFANTSPCNREKKDTIRTLYRLDIMKEEGGLRIEYEADGFLYKMVRNLTGTLLEISSGRMEQDEIVSLFETGDRKKAGPTAPAQGLFLKKVNYSKF